jgi:diguanylate cyclase (GGDEF)-like protein/PAS domain S-box-containing protein
LRRGAWRALSLCPLHVADTDQLRSGNSVCARVLGGLETFGATLALIWLLAVPHGAKTSSLGVGACVAVAYLIGLSLLTWARELSVRWIQVVVGFTIVGLISGALHFAGPGGNEFFLFYVLAALYSFSFLRPMQALFQGLLIAVSYAAVLLIRNPDLDSATDITRWLFLVGISFCSGGLLLALSEGLRRGERRFRNGLEASPIGAALLDARGQIMYANPALRTLLGLEHDAPGPQLLAAYLTPCGWKPLLDALAGTRDGEQLATQFTTRVANAEATDVAITVSQVPEREPLHTLVMVQDVSDRIRARSAELALADRERRYRLMFEHNPQPMWVYDPVTLRFLDVNDRAVNVYGYTREEFLSMTLEQIRPARDRERLRQDLAEMPTGVSKGDLWRHLTKSGEVIDVDVFADDLEFDGRHARLVVAIDVTARLEAERQLRYQADHDSLTGVLSRRRLEREIDALLSDSPTRRDCAVVVFDIDHFKLINDTFGHAHGDAVMRRVAEVLSSEIRPGELVGRLGGDEFAVLLPDTGERDAYTVATRMLEHLKHNIREGKRAITASAGVAVAQAGGEPVTAEDLLIAADIALYDAKDAGRDRCAVATGIKRGRTWIDEIRDALAEGRLVLHSQPIVDVATGEQVREEVLVRMLDPAGEVIPPASFIPAAERFGLINEIDRRVVARSIELARTGRRLAVNLSAHSLGDRQITKMVAEAVGAGLDPASLTFEITETAAAANYREAADFAERLSRIGCGFALDDFGTGYGSLSYLKHIPFGYLKIDMEFVRELTAHRQSQRIVRIVVKTAAELGQKTIAEGVEDAETLTILRGLGVDYAQGYHIARPAPIVLEPSPGPLGEPQPAPPPAADTQGEHRAASSAGG